jgi:hypothetical protein
VEREGNLYSGPNFSTNVIQSSFSTSERGDPEENIALAKSLSSWLFSVYPAGCFQFIQLVVFSLSSWLFSV